MSRDTRFSVAPRFRRLEQVVKARLEPESVVWRSLRAMKHTALGHRTRTPIPIVFDALTAELSPVWFVQIGSNDGLGADPLRDYILSGKWSGVLVEPVKPIFDRLRETYAGVRGLAFENSAIAETSGIRPFYAVDQTDNAELPEWSDELGSFCKEIILTHRNRIPDLDQRIVETAVPCTTFDDLCRKYSIDTVDVIQVDTEGYDYTLIKSMDLKRYRPVVVLYEHKHLAPADRHACREHLAAYGFEVLQLKKDSLAVSSQRLFSMRAGRRVLQKVRAAAGHFQ